MNRLIGCCMLMMSLAITGEAAEPSEERTTKSIGFGVSGYGNPRAALRAYRPFINYMQKRLGRKVSLVQRRSYQELNGLLQDGAVAFGHISNGAYQQLATEHSVNLAGVPVRHGSRFFRAVIIVPRRSPVTRFLHLRGKHFAYLDPLSISGYRFPRNLISKAGEKAANFFSRITFTHGHDASIRAVMNNDVDGASVDESVLQDAISADSQVGEKVRILHISPQWTRRPFVISHALPAAEREHLREALQSMHLDKQGQAALKHLRIERIVAITPADYWAGQD